MAYELSNLRELEAESIHIIREVAAEFENPVMMYSIGKDSMVMLRIAQKAFYPAPLPFPRTMSVLMPMMLLSVSLSLSWISFVGLLV